MDGGQPCVRGWISARRSIQRNVLKFVLYLSATVYFMCLTASSSSACTTTPLHPKRESKTEEGGEECEEEIGLRRAPPHRKYSTKKPGPWFEKCSFVCEEFVLIFCRTNVWEWCEFLIIVAVVGGVGLV